MTFAVRIDRPSELAPPAAEPAPADFGVELEALLHERFAIEHTVTLR